MRCYKAILISLLFVTIMAIADDKIDTTLDLPVDAPIFKPHNSTVSGPSNQLPPPNPPPVEEKPPTIYGMEVKSENNTIYYVLDVSDSMLLDVNTFIDDHGNAVSGNRLDRAKVALIKSLMSLPESYKFDIIAYDCHPSWICFKSLTVATQENKNKAIQWIRQQTTHGLTGTASAVGVALADKNNKLVVLLTDGDPNCDAIRMTGNIPPEMHRADIRWANTQNAVIHVFGIAATNAMRKFCIDVASDNGGNYTDVR